MVGIPASFGGGLSSGAMLVSGRVILTYLEATVLLPGSYHHILAGNSCYWLAKGDFYKVLKTGGWFLTCKSYCGGIHQRQTVPIKKIKMLQTWRVVHPFSFQMGFKGPILLPPFYSATSDTAILICRTVICFILASWKFHLSLPIGIAWGFVLCYNVLIPFISINSQSYIPTEIIPTNSQKITIRLVCPVYVA